MPNKIHYLSISEQSSLLKDKSLSPQEVATHFSQRIEKIDLDLNSFLTCPQDRAVANYDENKILSGIQFAAKDNFVTKDILTTAGSKMLQNWIPPYNSTIISALAEEGAVLLGKTNCDEFAQGSTGEYSAYGATLNPWNTTCVSGGSSSGSAAAVSAGLCTFALGTDTGGSIRNPAAHCGVVGLKPSYGRLSRYGVIAMASSLDCPGIIARSIEDVQAVFKILAKRDSFDQTSISAENTANMEAPLKIGIPNEYFESDLDPNLKLLLDQVQQWYGSTGFEIVPISLPNTDQAVPTYYILVPAEISSNMARFDGIRFGGSEKYIALEDIPALRSELFGEEGQRRILLGCFVLSSGYQDQYYKKALVARELIRSDFEAAFKNVDLILTPVTTGTAPMLNSLSNDPLKMYNEDVFTAPASLAGLPAISIPCGFANSMPVGFQLIAPKFQEELLFYVGIQYEKAHEWGQMHPEKEI